LVVILVGVKLFARAKWKRLLQALQPGAGSFEYIDKVTGTHVGGEEWRFVVWTLRTSVAI
jgi:hypothetical protein